MSRGLALKDLPPELRDVVRRHRKPVPYVEELSAGRILDVRLDPCPSPRMTRADSRPPVRPCVARYRAYQDALKAAALEQDFKLPDSGCSFLFVFQLTPAAIRKGLKAGDPYQEKPDLDNLVKAVWDSLRPKNDCKIYHTRDQKKIWGDRGRVLIQRF